MLLYPSNREMVSFRTWKNQDNCGTFILQTFYSSSVKQEHLRLDTCLDLHRTQEVCKVVLKRPLRALPIVWLDYKSCESKERESQWGFIFIFEGYPWQTVYIGCTVVAVVVFVGVVIAIVVVVVVVLRRLGLSPSLQDFFCFIIIVVVVVVVCSVVVEWSLKNGVCTINKTLTPNQIQ